MGEARRSHFQISFIVRFPYQTPPRVYSASSSVRRRPSVVVVGSQNKEISAKFFSVCSRFIFFFEFYNILFWRGIKSGRCTFVQNQSWFLYQDPVGSYSARRTVVGCPSVHDSVSLRRWEPGPLAQPLIERTARFGVF
jgi:hypothetical protein